VGTKLLSVLVDVACVDVEVRGDGLYTDPAPSLRPPRPEPVGKLLGEEGDRLLVEGDAGGLLETHDSPPRARNVFEDADGGGGEGGRACRIASVCVESDRLDFFALRPRSCVSLMPRAPPALGGSERR
jgi:hypothetical protein